MVYLLDGDDPICYYRCRPDDFIDPDAEMQWVPLINDQAVGEITDAYKAGMVSFRM